MTAIEMMSYTVKEIYYTLQGEGAQSGRAAVFCRFADCNLWSGHEADRGTAVCRFCDTDFVGTDGPGGGDFASPGELAEAIARAWPSTLQDSARQYAGTKPLVVCTGGEQLLQLDKELIDALHERGFEVAIETNGTLTAPAGIDWVCVSPKAGAALRLVAGDELKLIYPQEGARPEDFERLDFQHFFLQPMDGPDVADNTRRAVSYCLAHPRWRISLQTHKILGIK
jgi:7-carboxy-7-deazaguanine synthase (Cx14CxxC type)